MALTPEQAFKLQEPDKKLIDDLERAIDTKLGASYDGETVSLPMSVFLSRRARQELERRYSAANWQVKWDEGQDQREGSWCNIVLTPIRTIHSAYWDER